MISSARVLTPYYNEDVTFSIDNLEKENEDGVSILFYLQKIFPGFFSLSIICFLPSAIPSVFVN